MYWSAFTTAFFGFMRVSEFTAANDMSLNERTFCGKDVHFKEDMVVLYLRQIYFITAAMQYSATRHIWP